MTSSASAATCLPSEACYCCCAADAQGMFWCTWCAPGGYALCVRCSHYFCCPCCQYPAHGHLRMDSELASVFQDSISSTEDDAGSTAWYPHVANDWSQADRFSMLEQRMAMLELSMYRQSGAAESQPCGQASNLLHQLSGSIPNAPNDEILAAVFFDVMQRHHLICWAGWTADGRPLWTFRPPWY